MKGQWIGRYTGSTEGTIIVNVDERSSYYQGIAYLNEDNKTLPNTGAVFRSKTKDRDFQLRTDLILPINPFSGNVDSWENIKQHYPENVTISKYADVSGSWDDTALSLSWTSALGTTGSCVLPRTKAAKPSELVPKTMKWESYKKYVASLEGRRYLFRGQTRPWRLRTSFHRTGRADLGRFLGEDIQALLRHLSARTKHVFNLDIANENGAFFSLVQHHGYPTPLLDWTYSPYVAAFFAYRGISNERAKTAHRREKVRILVFDQVQWKSDWSQISNVVNAWLHFSVLEFLAIENERMIPQQAASTVTNIDDIESYVRSKESPDKVYLSAIDLPVHDRTKVVQELRYMGITAGSLFPGLDGACEELKERNFEI